MKQVTLLFLVTKNEVLLAMKKRGFGVGKINGVGGKVEDGESIEQAAIRECQEEIGVTVTACEKVAEIEFHERHDGQKMRLLCHVYIATDWHGNPVETEEMAPAWYPKNKLPLDQMWIDDEFWLPQVLNGKKLKAVFRIDSVDKKLLENQVTIVDKL